jgi:hypothetical protein
MTRDSGLFDSETVDFLSGRLIRVQTNKVYNEKAARTAVDRKGDNYENLGSLLP